MNSDPQTNTSRLVSGKILASDFVQLSYFTIMRAAEHKLLPCYSVGRSILFDPDEVIEAIKAGALIGGIPKLKAVPLGFLERD